MGFGLTYVLPVITAILGAHRGDLLLIENPEAHLHPAAQCAVVRLCALAAQNGIQLLIETHSDHFLNGVRVAVKQSEIAPEETSILFFDREEVQTVSLRQMLMGAK